MWLFGWGVVSEWFHWNMMRSGTARRDCETRVEGVHLWANEVLLTFNRKGNDLYMVRCNIALMV